MHRTKVILIALLALGVLVTALAGCGRRGLVRVNGEKISKDEFYSRLQRVPVQTVQDGKRTTMPAGEYVMRQMIEEQILRQLADKEKVAPTETQINKKVATVKKAQGADFRMMLAQQGKTEEQWRKELEVQQAAINIATKGFSVPESEVKAVYDKAIAADPSPFKRPKQARISMIMTSKKADIDKAYGLLEKGQQFGAVAMKISEHDSKQSQGQIPVWLFKGMPQIPKELVDTAFSLERGKYSKPFESDGKWLIVKLDRTRPAKTQSYAEVKDMIREQLLMRKSAEKSTLTKKMDEFVNKAEIVVNADRYKKLPDAMRKEAAQHAKQLAQKAGETGTVTTTAQPAKP